MKTKGMRFIKYFPILIVISTVCLSTVALAESPDKDFGSFLLSLFGNSSALITFTVEFLLGLGLGYFSVKALKYVLALIGIVVVGILLNIWQGPQIMKIIQEQLNIEWLKMYQLILAILLALGITTILPLSLGFIVGIVIGAAR
jgi:uncharacterized membrane protein (Fun14 family)